MKLFLFVCLFAIAFAGPVESENAKLKKTNQVLVETLKELAVGSQTETKVGGCYSTSGSCKSGYYKLSGGSSCCPSDNGKNWWGWQEERVGFGFTGSYKCTARNNCIYDCQENDASKTWYACMKECPKSLCDNDSTSDSVDPEESDSGCGDSTDCGTDQFCNMDFTTSGNCEPCPTTVECSAMGLNSDGQSECEFSCYDSSDSEEEAVSRWTCKKDGFEGTVTSDSWCDKRDGVWMHKCSDCKYGYYWYWWHTYCCVKSKSGCQCAYN